MLGRADEAAAADFLRSVSPICSFVFDTKRLEIRDKR